MAMFCPHCGNELEDGSLFCGYCGNKLDERAEAVTAGGPVRQEGAPSSEAPAAREPGRPAPFYEAPTEVYPAAAAPAAPEFTPGQAYAAAAMQPAQAPKKSRKPLIAVIVAIVAVAAAVVVVGFTTNWFGLAGGAQGRPLYVMTSASTHPRTSDQMLLQNKVDEHGNIVETTAHQMEGVTLVTEYQYDEKGLATGGTSTAEFDEPQTSGTTSVPVSVTYKNTTNESGLLTKRTAGSPGDPGYNETDYEYYDSGRIRAITLTITLPGDYYEAHQTITREFDEDGLISQLASESDYASTDTRIVFEWEKDSSGRPVSVSIKDAVGGGATELTVETDENGNITRLFAPGDDSEWIEFSYQLIENPSPNAAATNGVFDISMLLNGGMTEMAMSPSATAAESSSSSSSSADSETSTEKSSDGSSSETPSSSEGTFATSAPVFTDIYASSELPGDAVTSYYGARNAIDGKTNTAWNEGAEGRGIGEWIEMSAPVKQTVSGIRIMGGYNKTNEIYYKNHRPRQVTIAFDDGSTYTGTMSDAYNQFQDMKFDEPVRTSTLRVTIDSVYEGSYYDDCCITEIEVY